jgi:hypothetical protein
LDAKQARRLRHGYYACVSYPCSCINSTPAASSLCKLFEEWLVFLASQTLRLNITFGEVYQHFVSRLGRGAFVLLFV